MHPSHADHMALLYDLLQSTNKLREEESKKNHLQQDVLLLSHENSILRALCTSHGVNPSLIPPPSNLSQYAPKPLPTYAITPIATASATTSTTPRPTAETVTAKAPVLPTPSKGVSPPSEDVQSGTDKADSDVFYDLTGQATDEVANSNSENQDDVAMGETAANALEQTQEDEQEQDEDQERGNRKEGMDVDRSEDEEKVDESEPTMTLWSKILSKLYPGQVALLHRTQKDRISEAVHEYLVDKLGKTAADASVLPSGRPPHQKPQYAVPNYLVDDFSEWIATKLDSLVLEDESFSSHPSRRKSGIISASPQDRSSKSTPKGRKGKPDSDFVAWTDLARSAYSELSGLAPKMSYWVKNCFLKEHKIPETLVSTRHQNTRCMGIPRSLHKQFLKDFRAAFYIDGAWRESYVELKPSSSTSFESKSTPEEAAKEARSSGPHRTAAADKQALSNVEPQPKENPATHDTQPDGVTSRHSSQAEANNITGNETQSEETPAQMVTDKDPLSKVRHGRISKNDGFQLPPLTAEKVATAIESNLVKVLPNTAVPTVTHPLTVWKDVVTPRFSEYIESQATNTYVLARIRNAIRMFLSIRAPSIGMDPGQCVAAPEGKGRRNYAIPEPLLKDFEEWFACQVALNFKGFPEDFKGAPVPDPNAALAVAPAASEEGNVIAIPMSDFPVAEMMAPAATADSAPVQPKDATQPPTSAVEALKRKGPPTIFTRPDGTKLVRYLHVLILMMKDFPKLPKPSRAAVKKGVKDFLLAHTKNNIAPCIMKSDTDDSQTYGIPENLLDEFKGWAFRELRRCFPEYDIADPFDIRVF
ncbi:hypothetical protein HDU97_001929 [Phlyctochytrium planicorne]|nr:hypothetical protein HDU97_001929 [Phlyctochytrium planicorne]